MGIKELVQSEAPTPKGQGGGKAPGRAQLPGAGATHQDLALPKTSPCIALHAGGRVRVIAKIQAIIEHFKKLIGIHRAPTNFQRLL